MQIKKCAEKFKKIHGAQGGDAVTMASSTEHTEFVALLARVFAQVRASEEAITKGDLGGFKGSRLFDVAVKIMEECGIHVVHSPADIGKTMASVIK